MRSNVLAAAVVLVAATGAARAENFQGPYVGLQLGQTFGDVDTAQSTSVGGALTSAPINIDLSDAQAGVQLGYDHRFQEFLVGVTVDYNAWNDYTDDDGAGVGSNVDLNDLETHSIATLRARVGWFALPRTLVFASVGGAWLYGNASIPVSNTTVGNLSSAEGHDVDFSGWAYGLGVEVDAGENFTLGFQWRHYDFEQQVVSYTSTNNNYDVGLEPDLDTIALTLNYHFGDLLK